MAKKEILDKLSIYIPQKKMDEKPVERLSKLGDKVDRSINYLVVEAILQYLDREEPKHGLGKKPAKRPPRKPNPTPASTPGK